jgi:hypothetical protein
VSVVIWHFDWNLNSIKFFQFHVHRVTFDIWHTDRFVPRTQLTPVFQRPAAVDCTVKLLSNLTRTQCEQKKTFTWDFVYYNFVWILSNLKSCISISSSFYRRSSKVTLTPVKTTPSPFFNLPFTIQQFTPQYTYLLF